jgi:hypothetical protein
VHRAFLEVGGYEVQIAHCSASGIRLVRETLPMPLYASYR